MSLIARFFSLFWGKSKNALDTDVRNNVSAAYAAEIAKREDLIKALRESARTLKALQFEGNESYSSLQKQMKQLKALLDKAVEAEDAVSGAELINELTVLESELEIVQEKRNNDLVQVNLVVDALRVQETELSKLKTEAAASKGIVSAAKAMDRVNNILGGADATSQNLAVARDAVKQAKYQTQADAEIDRESPESKIAAIKEKLNSASASDKFAEMLAKKKQSSGE